MQRGEKGVDSMVFSGFDSGATALAFWFSPTNRGVPVNALRVVVVAHEHRGIENLIQQSRISS